MTPPVIPYPRAALDVVVDGMAERLRYRWICGPQGLYREALPRPRVRMTYAQALALAKRWGVYEWGGPTGAKPGRCWLTAYPEPWVRSWPTQWRKKGIMLAMVTEYVDELGYLNFFWDIEIAGDALVLKALGWLRAPRPGRCLRCAVRRCLTCSWAYRKGHAKSDWSCACTTCMALMEHAS